MLACVGCFGGTASVFDRPRPRDRRRDFGRAFIMSRRYRVRAPQACPVGIGSRLIIIGRTLGLLPDSVAVSLFSPPRRRRRRPPRHRLRRFGCSSSVFQFRLRCVFIIFLIVRRCLLYGGFWPFGHSRPAIRCVRHCDLLQSGCHRTRSQS